MDARGPAAPGGRARIAALDAARALGVAAMVLGHTLDALLAATVRESAALSAYWKARGLTAPLFMMASGWAVAVSISRSGLGGLDVARGRLPRVLLLLALGWALHWPGWGVDLLAAGDASVWAHLLAFDALHPIAISLLAASLVLGLPWSARERALALALLAVSAVALGMRAPAPLPVEPASLPTSLAALALRQAAGGTSAFPLFPWAAYFFAGAIVGILAGPGGRRAFAAMGAAGGALVAATCWTGVGTMPPGHPALVAFRVGAVLVLFAALSAAPSAVASRLAPLGRASLAAYAIHVPLVYGWSTLDGLAQRIGPRLSLAPALGAAALVLAASVALRGVAVPLLDAARSACGRAWERRRAAASAVAAALRRLGEG